MAALSWLMNLDFAGSGVGAPEPPVVSVGPVFIIARTGTLISTANDIIRNMELRKLIKRKMLIRGHHYFKEGQEWLTKGDLGDLIKHKFHGFMDFMPPKEPVKPIYDDSFIRNSLIYQATRIAKKTPRKRKIRKPYKGISISRVREIRPKNMNKDALIMLTRYKPVNMKNRLVKKLASISERFGNV